MNINDWSSNFNQIAINAKDLAIYNKISTVEMVNLNSDRLVGVLYKKIKIVSAKEYFDFGLTPRAKQDIKLGNITFSEGEKLDANNDISIILTEDSKFIILDNEIIGIDNSYIIT